MGYTIGVTVGVIAAYLEDYVCRGLIKLDPAQDVVVITGGGSNHGLGHEMALLFHQQGYDVAVMSLDFEWSPPDDKIKFFPCDVTDTNAVQTTAAAISKAFPGKTATALINNAGIAHNKTVLEVSEETVRKVIDVNLLGAFWTVRAFVPNMQKAGRGYIVNVSSILGTLGVSQLSAYCASKAGLIAFHDSITHELGNPYNYFQKAPAQISTLLVTPGHISTSMFQGVDSPSDWAGPILTSKEVATSIVSAMQSQKTGRLSMPFYTRFTWAGRAVPGFVWEYVRYVSGLDAKMDTFVGNTK